MQNVLEKFHWKKALTHVLKKNMNTVIVKIKCNDANFVQIID